MLQETLGELAKTEQRAWDVEPKNGSGDFFNIDIKTINIQILCLLFLTMILKIVIRNCADVQIISVVGAFPPNAFPLAKRTIYSAENGVKMM